jgi:hypothetical protein
LQRHPLVPLQASGHIVWLDDVQRRHGYRRIVQRIGCLPDRIDQL